MAEQIDTKSRKNLLLLFHGGIVLYLILHNIVIPVIRGVYDLHFQFAPHILLLILFFRYDFRQRPPTFILLWVNILFIANFLESYVLLVALLGKKGAGANYFSITLSLSSLWIFFLVFYFHFHSCFGTPGPSWMKGWRGYVITLAGGVGMFFILNSLSAPFGHNPYSDSGIVKKGKRNFQCRRFFPAGQEIMGNDFLWERERFPLRMELDSCGFKTSFMKWKPGTDWHINDTTLLIIGNGLPEKELLRLERLNGEKWNLQKVFQVPGRHDISIMSHDFKSEGFFRLRSGLKVDKGVLILEIKTDGTFSSKNKIWVSLTQGKL